MKSIYEYYKSGMTLKEISQRTNKSLYIIRKHLKNKGIINKVGRRIKYTLNETRFNKIETEEDAYWLGFLYADGYINSKRNVTSLSLSGEDRFFIEHFKEYLNFTGNIIVIKGKAVTTNDRSFYRKEAYRLDVYNNSLQNNLIKQGCTANKSNSCEFPKHISSDLIHHFVRGYFDGDGSLFRTKNNLWRIAVIGSDSFINAFKEVSPVKGYYIKEKRSKGMNNYKIARQKDVVIFLKWLYKDANIYLPRKYNKMNDCLLEFSTTTTPIS